MNCYDALQQGRALGITLVLFATQPFHLIRYFLFSLLYFGFSAPSHQPRRPICTLLSRRVISALLSTDENSAELPMLGKSRQRDDRMQGKVVQEE